MCIGDHSVKLLKRQPISLIEVSNCKFIENDQV